ncbi:hypothetical protein F5148DRAFT_458596 [Russula earlei]|uniref:Uncharacterized protein n=1 Tax=Russula earlei TaxID=71964 RepID=A0ACC0TYK4_9AGAM|nr:hypothetical protein F5148DRAFT_458596 [Russula earlei]
MFSSSHDPALASLLLNMEPYTYHQNMPTTYRGTEGSWLSHGTAMTLEPFSCDSDALSQEDVTRIMRPFGYSMTPTEMCPEASFDSSFTRPTTTAITQNFSSTDSTWAHPTPWASSPKTFSGNPNEMGQVSYYSTVLDQRSIHGFQRSTSPPNGLSTFGDSLDTPPSLGGNADTTEVMDVKPGEHNAIHLGSLPHLPMAKRRKHEGSADQIGGQRTIDRRFACTIDDCGKDFSGEWEKMRHIRSIHCPPTIGCRACNYKQSRKDLFSEHCKKRHRGESVDELMVQLVTPSA